MQQKSSCPGINQALPTNKQEADGLKRA